MSSRRGRSGGCRRRSSREREGEGQGQETRRSGPLIQERGPGRGIQAEETRGKQEEERTGESEGEEEKLVLSLVQCY